MDPFTVGIAPDPREAAARARAAQWAAASGRTRDQIAVQAETAKYGRPAAQIGRELENTFALGQPQTPALAATQTSAPARVQPAPRDLSYLDAIDPDEDYDPYNNPDAIAAQTALHNATFDANERARDAAEYTGGRAETIQTVPNYAGRPEAGLGPLPGTISGDPEVYGQALENYYGDIGMGIGSLGPDFSYDQGLGAYTDAMGYGDTSGRMGRGAHAGLTSVGPTFGPEGWALDQGSQYSSQPEAVAASIASKGRATQAALDYELDQVDAGGGADEGTVICTELHRQGLINGDLFRADKKVGETLMRTDPDLMAGYHAWGRPVAKILKKYPVLALIVKPLVLPVIKELAVKEGGSLFGSVVGKAMLFIGAPICRAIGRMRKVGEALNEVRSRLQVPASKS